MTQRPGPYEPLITDRTFDALDRLRALSERAGHVDGRHRRWRGCWPTIASTQVVVGPGRPDHLEPVREALAHPLAADELVHRTSVFA